MTTTELTLQTAPPRPLIHCGEIFIVDDDEDMREILASILSLEGYPVIGFSDGDTFLKKASNKIPVCVFLDFVMPGRSGLDVLHELHARNYPSPIFLISARDDTPMVVDALKHGANDFLHKPFDPYRAVELVREAVELWRGRQEKQNPMDLEDREFPGKIHLTRREAEVLTLIVRGQSSKEVGTNLGIGPRSVDNLRTSIMRKLGARNVADLVRIVMS